MKRFQVLLLSLFLCVLPSVCFAEISLSDLVDVDTSLSVELMPDMQTDIAYGYGPGRVRLLAMVPVTVLAPSFATIIRRQPSSIIAQSFAVRFAPSSSSNNLRRSSSKPNRHKPKS